jgi:hypothetical protein
MRSPVSSLFAVSRACVLALVVVTGNHVAALAQTPTNSSPAGSWTQDRPNYFDPLGGRWNDGSWWWSGFAGVVARNYTSRFLVLDPDFGNSYMIGGAIGREYAKFGWLRFEWETSASIEFLGEQPIGDFRVMPLNARLVEFPWNRWVLTTFATGIGFSWMTSKSRYEEDHGDKTKRWNVGVLFELTLADPDRPDWAALIRIQHRSPLLGLLPDHGNTLDFFVLGVKHRF